MPTDSTPGIPRDLFVVGLMRSGTSLLYRLINSHPQVALTYEIDLFALRPLLWSSWEKGAWHKRLDFWNGALRRHGIDGEDLTSQLPPWVSDPAEAYRALAHAYSVRKPGMMYVGDKSIHYHDALPTIGRLLPEARFVVLHRPIAGIIDSVRRAGASNDYLNRRRRRRLLFQRYTRLLEGVVTLRDMNRQVHELHYPEMIRDPETACRGICDFLELPFVPEMLTSKPESVVAIPEARHHFNARYAKVGVIPVQPIELPARVAARVAAYEDYWAKRFANCPVRPALGPAATPARPLRWFSIRQRINRLTYEIHHMLFSIKLFVYRYAPIPLLRLYRAYAGYDPNGGRLKPFWKSAGQP